MGFNHFRRASSPMDNLNVNFTNSLIHRKLKGIENANLNNLNNLKDDKNEFEKIQTEMKIARDQVQILCAEAKEQFTSTESLIKSFDTKIKEFYISKYCLTFRHF